MSLLPSIAASGLALLARGEERLARSAVTFARSGEPGDPAAAGVVESSAPAAVSAAGDTESVVDAALGVVYGRSAFEIGIRLVAVGRETEQQLVDVLA